MTDTAFQFFRSSHEDISDSLVHGFSLGRISQLFPMTAVDLELGDQMEMAALHDPAIVSGDPVAASEPIGYEGDRALSRGRGKARNGRLPVVVIFSARTQDRFQNDSTIFFHRSDGHEIQRPSLAAKQVPEGIDDENEPSARSGIRPAPLQEPFHGSAQSDTQCSFR